MAGIEQRNMLYNKGSPNLIGKNNIKKNNNSIFGTRNKIYGGNILKNINANKTIKIKETNKENIDMNSSNEDINFYNY